MPHHLQLPPLGGASGIDGAGTVIQFNDDGGWCWYQDERVVIDGDKVYIGSLASGWHEAARRGDVEVTVYDLSTGAAARSTLHHPEDEEARRRWLDDHNAPAFLVRPDGRVLAMYAEHDADENIRYRISASPQAGDGWGGEKILIPSQTSRVTYSNLHRLSREGEGRVYDFFRGLDNSFKPSYAYSDDLGETWTPGNVFIDVPAEFRHRPYVKYASCGGDTVHIAYTEGHPRDFDNSIYHIFYRDGVLHSSDGAAIASLKEGLQSPDQGTRVFRGDADGVAWIIDLHVDKAGKPYLAYSVQKNSAGLPPGQGGEDIRYRYARWTGSRWVDTELAYAGHKLYAGEDDYTGLVALDPEDANVAYISTNADPSSGEPLVSRADGRRHWEIFRGNAGDGLTWTWTPVTKDSDRDNLRPVVPIWPGDRYLLLWLRGELRAYTDYNLEVVGTIGKR